MSNPCEFVRSTIMALPVTFGGHLSANFFVEAGTAPSRFRKNHGNVVSTFQEPITFVSTFQEPIFLSNKSAEREKSHQLVTR